MANRFPEATEEVHDNLSRRSELVTLSIAEVTPEWDRKVGVGLKTRQDQLTILA